MDIQAVEQQLKNLVKHEIENFFKNSKDKIEIKTCTLEIAVNILEKHFDYAVIGSDANGSDILLSLRNRKENKSVSLMGNGYRGGFSLFNKDILEELYSGGGAF